MLDPSSMPSLFETTSSEESESSLTDQVNGSSLRLKPSPPERNRSQGRSTNSGGRGVMSCGTVNELVGSTGTFRKNPIVCRQNVAIATQVISPSAIGGSLHRRRLVRHFGPVEEEDDEDDDGLFTRKRKMDWRRIFCYALGIVATLLLMTGVVLAVGYLQSEKQRILTRSPKLGHFNLNSAHTESRSLGPEISIPILSTDSSQEFGMETEYFDLESDTEYPLRQVAFETSTDDVPENSTETIMVEIDDGSNPNVILDLANNELEDNSSVKSLVVSASESPTPDLPSESDIKDVPIHHHPSEVKVLPPDDFRFQSFEIPIYNVSDSPVDLNARKLTLSVRNKLDELAGLVLASPETLAMTADPKVTVTVTETPAGDSTPENSDDAPPVVAKLQTDLFDGDSVEDDSEQARNDPPPKVTVPDRNYTPRPGSKIMYRERPPKPKPHQLIKFVRRKPGYHRFLTTTESPSHNDIPNHDEGFQPSSLDKTESTTKPPPSAPAPYLPSSTEAPIDHTTETVPHYDFTHGQGSSDFEYNTQRSSAALSNFDFQSILKTTGDAPAVNLDFSQFTTPSPIHNSFDFSQFSTQAPTNDYSHFLNNQNFNNYQENQPQNSYNFHSIQAPPTVNPYAHFLNPQNVASVMGLPSPLGANLNFNLDTNGNIGNYGGANNDNYGGGNYGGGNNDNYGGGNYGDSNGLPTSVIPLDLARSYIQAGNPAPLQTSTNDYSAAAFSHNNPVYSSSSNGGSNGNYNTITQGIHLLSLLSGNIPSHLMGQSQSQFQGADQFSSGNTQNFQHLASPSYSNDDLSSSTSTFLTNFNLGAFGSATVPSYTPYLPQTYNFQQSSAISAELNPARTLDLEQQSDQMGSFSQNIISKLTKPKEVPKNSVASDSVEQAEELDVLGLTNLMNSKNSALPTPNFLRVIENPEDSSSRRPPVKKDSPYDSIPIKSQDLIRPIFSIASPITGKKLIFKVKKVRAKDAPDSNQEPIKLEIKSGFYT